MTLANGRAGHGLSGGAIMSFHSLTLDQTIIRNSSAIQGGGIAFGTGYDREAPTITHSLIGNNTATTGNACR